LGYTADLPPFRALSRLAARQPIASSPDGPVHDPSFERLAIAIQRQRRPPASIMLSS
jgi:hypothetical protein